MMKYYNLMGGEHTFSVDDFVEEYEGSYYLDVEKDRYIPKVSINSRKIELVIQNILDQGLKKPQDVDLFLAWKIGGINHIQSENNKNNSIKFISTWNPWESNNEIKARYFKCDNNKYTKFCNKIFNIQMNRRNKEDDVLLEEIIHAISDTDIKGLGVVYILTILYFITQQRSPIFDKFAYTAIKAIYNGIHPEKIWYENPSLKNESGIIQVIEEYKWYLTKVFGKSDIPRSYDRALWVYGHVKSDK